MKGLRSGDSDLKRALLCTRRNRHLAVPLPLWVSIDGLWTNAGQRSWYPLHLCLVADCLHVMIHVISGFCVMYMCIGRSIASHSSTY